MKIERYHCMLIAGLAALVVATFIGASKFRRTDVTSDMGKDDVDAILVASKATAEKNIGIATSQPEIIGAEAKAVNWKKLWAAKKMEVSEKHSFWDQEEENANMSTAGDVATGMEKLKSYKQSYIYNRERYRQFESESMIYDNEAVKRFSKKLEAWEEKVDVARNNYKRGANGSDSKELFSLYLKALYKEEMPTP